MGRPSSALRQLSLQLLAALLVGSVVLAALLDVELLLAASVAASLALWSQHRAARAAREQLVAALTREASARRVELLSEHADDAVLLVDAAGHIVRANERIHEYYGWSSAELVGRHLRELRAPGHADLVDAQIAQIRAAGRLRYPTVHRRRDGSTLPVEVSARGFEDEGRWFFQAVVRDQTEHHQTLRTLSFQAELLQNLHDAVIGLDAGFVIRSWNAAAEQVYGFRAAEVIGRSISEALPSEYEGFTFETFVAALHRSERLRFEVRRRHRSGAWVDVEGSAVVLRGDDHRVTGYVSVNRDVTRQKRAEAALRTSQERLAQVLETSSEGIWIVDREGLTEFANDRAAKLMGVSQEVMLGRRFSEFVPATGAAKADADLAAVLRGEGVRRELVMSRPGAEDVWISLSWSAVRDPEGRVVGAVAVFMDVTEQRRAREQLLQAQKMDAVGRLASGIAHDFNNLLVTILSGSEYLFESLPEGDPRRDDARDVLAAGERAARLVRQLLAFGRKSAHRPVPVDVNAVVRGIEAILRRALGEQVTLSTALQPDPWTTRVDPGELEQVLMNLVVNARDAMHGGGELRIQTRNALVEADGLDAKGLVPGRYAVLSVADRGCGMTPEVLASAFEPFFTTKPTGLGTGLGLATVYAIVKEVGGTIAVESAPGRGTTFTVFLPACAPEARRDEAPEPRAARGEGETVLVVDDEASVRRVARRVLEDRGFQVIEAGGAAEALDRIRQGTPVDLVLTDVSMPGMSGTELAAAVGHLRPELPVLLMSGYSEAQRSPLARDVLQKPFTAGSLVAFVHARLRALSPAPAPVSASASSSA